MQGKRIGFALTGSFCTFKKVLPQVEALVSAGAEVTPIVSPSVAATDSRFGKAEDFWNELARMTGHEPLATIAQVEPIGPKKLLDLMIVAPCTGNTLAKLALGITVYYPASQYSMVSGSAGACQFYYYELEDGLSELGKALFASEETADAAKGIRDAVAAGSFPNWVADVKLGEPIGTYMKEYTLLTDPDYTLESRVYLFEEPQLRGMSLETWLYAECEEEEAPLTAIRAARIDLFGIRPGISTLAECEKLLGAPDGRVTRDEDDAVDLMLEPGDSLFYVSGENTLEIHADEQGVVSCLILYSGKRMG